MAGTADGTLPVVAVFVCWAPLVGGNHRRGGEGMKTTQPRPAADAV